MITLNGKRFAEPDDSRADCIGTAKRLARQVKLFNTRGEMIGCINRFGVLCKATKLDSGKYWYSLATIPEIGEYESYMKHRDEIDAISLGREPIGGEIVYRFK